MKLIHTVERYAPEIGGAERVVERISTGLVARGHDVIVITSGARRTELQGGVRVERFPVRGNLARGLSGDPRPALEVIEAAEPDLVLNYAAQTWTTDACLQYLDRPRPFALVLAPCGFSGLYDPRYRDYFERMRAWLPRYDALVFHSSIYRDWDFAVGTGAETLRVIPNGADPAASTRELRSLTGDRPLVVTVGSHVRSKGHGTFVRIIDELRASADVQAAIVAPPRTGRDVVRGCYLRCVTRQVRRPWLRIIDGRDPIRVADALASANVFVLPSTVECAPLVVLESMAASVPWISFDVGNVRELPGGRVVESEAEIVRVTRDLMAAHGNKLGEEGYATWSQNHRWERIVLRYESVFEEAVDARKQLSPPAATGHDRELSDMTEEAGR